MLRYILFIILFCLCGYADAKGGVWVITQRLDEDIQLTRQQIRQIYMGINIPLTDQIDSSAVMLSTSHNVRAVFNAQIIGMTESRIQSYWAHMRFSGRSNPPIEYASVNELLDHLTTHKGSIGFVPIGTLLPEPLKLIYSSK
jgi:hypothetical protein